LRKIGLAVWVNKRWILLHHPLREIIAELEKDKGTSSSYLYGTWYPF
jgi:hypothetical protein